MYNYKAFVTKVYDGDTITVDIDLGFGIELKKQSIRLYGINTPEIRGDERELGLEVRDFLADVILGKEITITTIRDKKGKYGRRLGIIEYEGRNMNEELILKGYKQDYD